eukprot:TRINITY_DN60_c1_g1_i1.p1 TRINITY_DN60_c1_g1~~TRINITY_DN60_c1_g1_i1.p1  ORF type:complete len:514 (+),score=142.85 TRINITY_DN60_c1_g1_i1:79-1542(+)
MARALVPDPDWCTWCDWDNRGLYVLAFTGGCSLLITLFLLTWGGRKRSRSGASRPIALVVGVISLLFTGCFTATFGFFGVPVALPVYCYLALCYFLNWLRLVHDRDDVPHHIFRWLVIIPGFVIFSASAFSIPCLPFLYWIPPVIHNGVFFLLALIGVFQSSRCTRPGECIHVQLGQGSVGDVPQRVSTAAPAHPPAGRPFTVFQLTDVHLGTFMTVERVIKICQRALQRNPDLVLLTGDYLTWEVHGENVPELIERGFGPLRGLAAAGRCFAGVGNHDYEQLPGVVEGFRRLGIPLLADIPGGDFKEAAEARLPCGRRVQIIGSRFCFRNAASRRWAKGDQAEGSVSGGADDPEQQLAELLERNPRPQGCFSTLLLLHNPSHFVCLPPENHVDLSLGGHYHGGQVGLVSCGCRCTLLGLFSRLCGFFAPDHGMWAAGGNLCYSHRGTGLYGFPVRLGVPNEESLLIIYPGGRGRDTEEEDCGDHVV